MFEGVEKTKMLVIGYAGRWNIPSEPGTQRVRLDGKFPKCVTKTRVAFRFFGTQD